MKPSGTLLMTGVGIKRKDAHPVGWIRYLSAATAESLRNPPSI
jgi:hypothetical protein